ncbi:serine/threonine protein kinase [Hyalangium rubrum]|uniref:Serine/threonine-protein kinase n=1 Tax=Hyalangium rubrum TaxID=3103134 RepID=A0ABU5HF81_9BACT|nr:serine/threonine-protein kinase [Hyalangium sp. s54d21]MDY7232016.1 serine/threonine-protein kinase [Hyalangium sp. s54d21]
MAERVVHPSTLVPGEWVGAWQIVGKLGSGSFGAVYKVECEGEAFALKFSLRRQESGEDDLNQTDARLRKELACLLRIQHPNVVRLHAFGCWPHPTKGYRYLLMDYVAGKPLARWARDEVPSIRRVLQVFDKLALTLEAIHRAGVSHRDLKSANILVRTRDEEPVLVDFGSGDHTQGKPITEGPLPPGTPHYRSPEALRFQREYMRAPGVRYAFRATDELYALGVALYEVLTGRPPFSPQLPREVLNAEIEWKDPPPPLAYDARVPVAVSDLVMRLLEKRPEDRPQSGQQLHEELQAVLTPASPGLEEKVVVRPPDLITTEDMP